MRRNDIDRIIEKHQTSAPVQIISMAHAMNMKVFETQGWPDNICGSITQEDGIYVIRANANHAKTRRRFTIAHEIAHFVLHRDLIGDGVQDDALYRSHLGSNLERQANSFAADLLMPWALVERCMKQGADSIQRLAQELQVSKAAMSIRLGIPFE